MKYLKILIICVFTGMAFNFMLNMENPVMMAAVSPQNSIVFICNSSNAYAYHDHFCLGLNRCSHSISKITISDAKTKGYKACGYCY